MKAVIMAGGKGTRISSVVSDIPKPMIPIAGKPILEHQIICLREQEIVEIIIVIGYLGHIIKEYFGHGDRWNIKISYFEEKAPLGTAGALGNLKEQINGDFILLNGDIIFNVDISRMIKAHYKKNALVTIFTHPNSHPFDSEVIVSDKEGVVIEWMHKEDKRIRYKNRVNAGIHIISEEVLKKIESGKNLNLDKNILRPLISTGRLIAYDSPEYVKDMGTPERYEMVCKDYASGKVMNKNLLNKQRAIFMDRDGTLNKLKGFITKPEQIELIEGAADAVKKINESGFLAIVITNQPVIARGECTEEELEEIHNQLETLLGNEKTFLDAIYYCPHHPDSGFDGERAELKGICLCRKPNPGLLLKAAKDFNIDLSASFMVGDSMSDFTAGIRAGCHSILLSKDKNINIDKKLVFSDLKSFVDDWYKEDKNDNNSNTI